MSYFFSFIEFPSENFFQGLALEQLPLFLSLRFICLGFLSLLGSVLINNLFLENHHFNQIFQIYLHRIMERNLLPVLKSLSFKGYSHLSFLFQICVLPHASSSLSFSNSQMDVNAQGHLQDHLLKTTELLWPLGLWKTKQQDLQLAPFPPIRLHMSKK